jgi:hypothetical protein
MLHGLAAATSPPQRHSRRAARQPADHLVAIDDQDVGDTTVHELNGRSKPRRTGAEDAALV